MLLQKDMSEYLGYGVIVREANDGPGSETNFRLYELWDEHLDSEEVQLKFTELAYKHILESVGIMSDNKENQN